MLPTQLPYPQFSDLSGQPLNGGSIYYGEANKNPETDPIAVYWDLDGTQPASQPVKTLNGFPVRAGTPAQLFADKDYSIAVRDRNNQLVFYAASSANFDAAGILRGQLGDTAGGRLLGMKRNALANAVATTLHLWHESQWVNLQAEYLNGAAGTAAQNTAALNNAIADLPSGGTLYIGNIKGDFPLNPITVSKNKIKLVIDKSTTLKWSALGANAHGITVEADDFEIVGGKLQGPGTSADIANEAGIWMKGASTSSRRSGLTLRDVEITGFGLYGVYGQFVNNIKVIGCNVHDTRMHGVCFLSCNDIFEQNNWVHDIVMGSNGNAYGFIHSHDSNGYASDPNAATNGRLAANPFCVGVVCIGNVVENIGWEGIDCHGAYDTVIAFNRVYNTKYGISAPSSSGEAQPYAGEQNFVINNLVTALKRDGTNGDYHNTGYGINLNGGTTVNNRRVICTGNVLIRKGEISTNGGGVIRAENCMHVTISDNIIHNWGGQGIYTLNSVGIIANNQFGGLASSGDTIGQCIKLDGNNDRFTITGNKHWYADRPRAAEGLRVLSTNTNRQLLSGNDFSEATTPYIVQGTQVLGTDITPAVDITGSGVNLDVAALAGFNGIVYLSANATHNVSDILNLKEGQQITVIKTGTGTVTFIRTGSPGIYLDQGTNKTLSGKNSISLRKLSGSVVQVGYSQAS